MSKNLLKLLLATATVTLYMLVIKPMYSGVGGVWQPEQSIQSLILLNSQYDNTLAQADGLVAQAKRLRDQYKGITENTKEEIAIMVPDMIDKVRLLDEVTRIAQTAEVALGDLGYAEGLGAAGGKSSVNITFSVKTTYPRFKSLMDNFEKSKRLFSIGSVTFSSPQKEGDLTTYNVKLQTYYLK